MGVDIRLKTGLIIQRGNAYLVGRIVGSTEYRWSDSPWDAWITRNRHDAERIAKKVGGDLMLFNPVAGQVRGLANG